MKHKNLQKKKKKNQIKEKNKKYFPPSHTKKTKQHTFLPYFYYVMQLSMFKI